MHTPASRPLHAPLAVLLIVLLVLTALPTPAHAAAWKLSRLGPVDGQLRGMGVAGNRLIYLANYELEARFDLYSKPVAGGARVRLNSGLPEGQVETFQFSPDRTQVIFTLQPRTGGKDYLYSVPAAGGTPIQLNDPALETGASSNSNRDLDFWMAEDRVVYRSGGAWLFSVPISGGTPTLLSPPQPGDGRILWVGEVQLSADKTLVAYQFYDTRLYTIPVAGGTPTQVNDSRLVGYTRQSFVLSADGVRLAYLTPTPALDDPESHSDLVSVASDGSDRRTLATGRELRFVYHARSGRLIYHTRDGDRSTIRSIPIGGGASSPIADALPVNSSGPRLLLSPYADVGFLMDTADGDLYRFPTTGGGVTRIAEDVTIGFFGIFFTPDGQRALYLSGNFADNRLYSYALAGGSPQRLDDPAVSIGSALELRIAPDSDRVFYIANTATSGLVMALFSVPVGGGAVTRISGAHSAAENYLFGPVFGPGDTVYYSTGAREPGSAGAGTRFAQIYRAPAAGGAAPVLVDRSQTVVGDVASFQISPSNGRVIYVADQEVDQRNDLYSVPIAGGEPVRLGPGWNFALSPAGGYVATVETDPATGLATLARVPIEGGPPEPRYTLADTNRFFEEIAFTPDGSQILFTVYENSGRTLYGVPAGGGDAAPIAQQVEAFQISPDSAYVVYRSDTTVLGDDLGVVRIADGATSPPIPIGEDSRLWISPDSTRVLFETRGMFGESMSLASRRLDGGPVTKLHSGDANTFSFTADSTRVLSLQITGSGADRVYRLVSVPLAGGAATSVVAIRGELRGFQYVQAGDRVVYAIARATNDIGKIQYTMASVPLAGGASTVLFGPEESGTTVFPIKVTPDGSRVVYGLIDRVWSVPISGGAASDLGEDRRMIEFQLTGDGRVLLIDSGGRLYINRATGGSLLWVNAGAEVVDSFRNVRDLGGAVVYIGRTGGEQLRPETGLNELFAADLLDRADLDQRVYFPLVAR